jgi:ABC-type Fe3+ transport system substrate-binding protein
VLAILSPLMLCAVSCHKSPGTTDAHTVAADQACRQKWGKGLDQLPTGKLVILSAHNENILDEYERAFSLHYAVEHGKRVAFDRRNVGGGGSSIQQSLLSVYGRGESPEIDVLWGGGEPPFVELARGLPNTGPLLEKLSLDADVLANIPAQYAGNALYDRELRWVGSALSGFGIIYNKGMLRRCGIEPPRNWQDLGDARFVGLLELADPSQSGSAAAAYRAVVISAPTWPEGWAKLMPILGNAKRIADSAGTAANAPALGEALVATCVDFYGTMRVIEAPDRLEYFTPAEQAVFTPDPIAVLKGAPHPQLAHEFVRFVLSRQGQLLWATQVGKEGGPIRRALGRQPIRRDVYRLTPASLPPDFLPYIVDPYAKEQAFVMPPEKVSFAVIRELTYQAAVANQEGLFKARQAVARRPELMKEFVRLPDNVATLEAMNAVAKELKDKSRLDELRRQWRDFFAAKYERICR